MSEENGKDTKSGRGVERERRERGRYNEREVQR